MWVHPRTVPRAPAKPVAAAAAWPSERRTKPPRSLARTVPATIREIDHSGSGDSDNSGDTAKDVRRTGPMRGQSNATATRVGTQRADGARRVKGPIAHMVALSGPDANVRARYYRQPAAVAKAAGDRAPPGPSRHHRRDPWYRRVPRGTRATATMVAPYRGKAIAVVMTMLTEMMVVVMTMPPRAAPTTAKARQMPMPMMTTTATRRTLTNTRASPIGAVCRRRP